MLDVLIDSTLFEGVPSTTIASIVGGSEIREFAAGEALLRNGTENDTLYVVLSGAVTVLLSGAESSHLRFGPGECVGELSIIDRQRVSADVIAHEPTLALAIDHDQLWWLVESSAHAARNLLRILAGRMRHDDVVIAESGQRQSSLERIATIDAMTGLRNRRWLDDTFARQLERALRTSQPASVLMIDVDYFKTVNDKHGHHVGDAVLCRIADLLASNLRPQDLIARYGGEEFAVFLPGLDFEPAHAAGERLRQTIESATATNTGNGLPPVTVSIGVASRLASDTLADLLRRADQSLYGAKQAGRNRIGNR